MITERKKTIFKLQVDIYIKKGKIGTYPETSQEYKP